MSIFDLLPNEMVSYILSFTREFSGIASRVCVLWNTLIDSKDKKIPSDAFDSLNLVMWGIENVENFSYDEVFVSGMMKGKLEILKYLHPNLLKSPNYDS